MKLNEGFSGEGNALMRLDEAAMTKAGSTKRRAALIQQLFPKMEFVNDVWKHYRIGIAKMGALGECWVEVSRFVWLRKIAAVSLLRPLAS